VTDADDGVIPGATVILDAPTTPDDHRSILTNERGFFELNNAHSAISYRVTVTAKGFADWASSAVMLNPGQFLDLTDVKLKLAEVETTVEVVFADQVALEQVQAEEKKRIFGVIPNSYVVYDHDAVPLTTKLKYQLALKTATDAVSSGGAAFLAGVNQAANTPDYVQGAKGYGERFGAGYASAFSDIRIGGAVLPSLLHQDPRYFYQGTGTEKSRALHAFSAPFVAKGDDGRWQPNYSSIGGDLASGAFSNLYYPASNRGAGLVFDHALVVTGGRIVSALAQEFILSRFTTRAKDKN
jgi:hypothetical protein